ncbi:MAG: rhodanese-like domain-containing protein [Methylococcales bacterium]
MSVTGRELSSQIEAGTAPIIVDVRSGWEYRQGSVPSAINLPFWRSWLLNDYLKINTGNPVIVYCEHGPRAVLAKLFLRLRGFSDVQLLKGHMLGWKKNGLPITSHQ